MNANDVIEYTRNYCSEYLEMQEDPDKFLLMFLANQVLTLTDHVQYLEKRIAK